MSKHISDLRAERPNLKVEHQGGGCMALNHPIDGGGFVLLTANGGQLPGDADEFIECGVYDVIGVLCGELVIVPIEHVAEWLDNTLEEIRRVNV